jgi:hypothetical protein
MPVFGLLLLSVLAAPGAVNSAPATPVITQPDWQRTPNSQDMLNLRQAITTSSLAQIRCRVDAQGALYACKVVSETPPGVGAGAAALKLAPAFRMKPATLDGKPVAGGEVVIPVHFDAGGPSLRYLIHPVWKATPNAADVAAATAAAGAPAGHAALDCTVLADGRLEHCHINQEVPDRRTVGRAALALVPRFQAKVDPASVGQGLPLHAALIIAFGAPPTPYVAHPDFVARPDEEQSVNIFPAAAAKAGLKTGRAVVDCAIAGEGALAGCRVTAEDPAGQGFGDAALKLTAYMKVSAWSLDGVPTAGKRLKMPIRLNTATAGLEAAPARP